MGRTARVASAVAVCAVLVAAGSAIVAGANDGGEDVEVAAAPGPTPPAGDGEDRALAALDASLDDLLAQIDALEDEIEATPASSAPPAGPDLRTSAASPTASPGSVAPGATSPGVAGAYEDDDEYDDDEYEDEHDQRDDD